jgi:EmrB/QacA subfamily drug resistance transporter
MYKLEDDDETSSRIQKQVLVGLAETQKHADLLKARPTRNLAGDEPPVKARPTRNLADDEPPVKARPTRNLVDDETPTSPGVVADVASVSAGEPANRQDGVAGASAGTMPDASPFFVVQEDDRTLADFPTGEHAFQQLLAADTLPFMVQGAADKKPDRRALAALTVVCVAVFFTAMDQTVVVTALPKMIPDLQLTFNQLDHAAWIISAYLLGFVVAMPLMGRVSDIHGRRLIFLLCLTIFGLGSVLCALALVMANIFDIGFLGSVGIDVSSQQLTWLVAARLIQAIGGGAIVPIAMAVASDFYGEEKRGLALGIVGAVTEAGGAFGPLYGAIVVDHLGWQAIFYLNVPVVLILFVTGCFFIPRGRRLLQGIDWLGAALLAGALTCLSIGLAQQGTSLGPVSTSSSSTNNPIALVLAVVFLTAFIVVELRVRWPVVDLAHFKRPTFSAASIVSLLVGAALIIAMADIPIYVDTVLRGSLLESGLALLRLTVMIPVGAVIGGWLCHRISCRWVGIASLLLTALGFFLMSLWPIQPSEWQITVSTVITGLGFGLVIAPIGTTAINSLWPSQAGVGSAVVTALRMVGMTLGLSVLTSWALARFQQLAAQYRSLPLNSSPAQASAWSQGYATHVVDSLHTTYTEVFLISAFICLVSLIPAFFLWGRQAPQVEPEEHALLLYEDESTLSPAVLGQRKRKRLTTAGIALLAVLVISGGLTAEWFREMAEYGGGPFSASNTNINSNTHINPGTRMFQLALDKGALTSIFAGQLGTQDALTDLSAVPGPNDGLTLTLNLHVNVGGIQRVIPVEIDGKVGLDDQQNLHITVQQLKRDGVVADGNTTVSMQNALNQMLVSTVMSTLHNQFKGTKLISVHTSTTIACAQQIEMIVLQVEAPAVAGVTAQPTPVPFCFKGPIDLKKLLPQ